MKKSLLLIAMALVSLCASAQWTKPEVKTSDMVVGEECYLYNAEAGAFLRGLGKSGVGPYWGTRAGVATDAPELVKINPAIATSVTEGQAGACAWLEEDDGETFILQIYPASKNRWDEVWYGLTDYVTVWVDRQNSISANVDCFYNITKNANGSYAIAVSPKATTLSDPDLLGELTDPDTGLSTAVVSAGKKLGVNLVNSEVCIEGGEASLACDWYFVSKEDFAAIDADAMAIYTAAMNLKAKIAATKEAHPEVNISGAEATYNNSSSTLEELQQAISDIDAAVRLSEVYSKLSGATEDEPKDASEFIVNADFSAGNIDGWKCTYEKDVTATNIGYQQNKDYSNGEIVISKFIEAWAAANTNFNPNQTFRAIGDGELSQTLPSLPAGKYKFTVDCIANQQDNAVTNVTGVQLFAHGGEIDTYQTISTGNGLPEHFEITFVSTGGDVTLGLRTVDCTANWIAADNFTLTYYGEVSDDPMKIALDGVIEQAIKEYDPDALDDVIASAESKEAYKNAISAGQSASGDYTSYSEAISSSLSALKQSVSAYSKYVTAMELYVESVENMDYDSDLWGEFVDYMTGDAEESYSYIKENGTITDIAAETTRIAELYKNAIIQALENVQDSSSEGVDATPLIVNPSFETGDFTGWERSSAATGDTRIAEVANETYFMEPADGKYVFNTWNSAPVDFYVQQTIKGLPAGMYKVQALVASDAETVLTFSAGVNTVDIKASPEGKAAAVEGELQFIINEGDDIVLKVSSSSWFKADNFRLTYYGSSVASYYDVIDTALEELQNYIDENGDNIGADVQTAYNKLSDDAKELEKSTATTKDDCTKFIERISEASDYAKASVAAYIKLGEDISRYEEVAESPNNTYCLAEANKYVNSIQAPYLDHEMTVAQAQAASDKICGYISLLSLPDGYQEANDNAPVDFSEVIVNADFELNAAKQQATGWTLVKGEGASGNYQIQTGYDGGVSMEFWSNTQGEGTKYDFYQRINGLPAGTYEITADASNSLNEQEAGEGTGAAYIYAAAQTADGMRTLLSSPIAVQSSGCRDEYNNYSVVIKLAEGEALVIGSKNVGQLSARWVMIDNFKLSYYGTSSTKTESSADPTAIESVAPATTAAAIYSVSGARVNALKKGINIVKMSDGSVKKVLVK